MPCGFPDRPVGQAPGCVAAWAGDRRGTIAIYLALALVPLMGFVGLAIDTGRGQIVKSQISQALDAAALAGGRVFFEESRDDDIRTYFAANFPPGRFGATLTPLDIQENKLKGTLTVTVSATLATTFMQVLGIDSMEVNARTVVQRADRGMELALVMDNTGSMYQGGSVNSRINRMKAAAKELVGILYGDREQVENFWVSLVPYTASVNVGSQHATWLASGSLAALNYRGVSSWKGCVEARDATRNDVTDATPATAPFKPFFFPPSTRDNNWPAVDERVSVNTTSNNGKGPNLGCGPAITPLTAEKSKVIAAINGMAAWHRGGTITSEGLAWGWRTISPKWRGLWGGDTPARLPLDYKAALMQKVVIILTDGKNELYRADGQVSTESDYTAYGRVSAGRLGTTTDYTGVARRTLNTKTGEICAAMKAEGVIIYAITFEVDNDTAGREGKATFKACASSPAHYFDNPVGADLTVTFRTIASQIGNLRIAE